MAGRTTITDILVTKLTVDGKSYNVELKKAGGSLDKMEKKTDKSFRNMKSSTMAAAAAVGILTAAVFKFIKLGAEQ